jgi:hypothetical protein
MDVMKYEVCDSDLNLVLEEAATEQEAIAFVIAELSTDVFPAVIREDNGEITAIVWCGVVYRPEQEVANA